MSYSARREWGDRTWSIRGKGLSRVSVFFMCVHGIILLEACLESISEPVTVVKGSCQLVKLSILISCDHLSESFVYPLRTVKLTFQHIADSWAWNQTRNAEIVEYWIKKRIPRCVWYLCSIVSFHQYWLTFILFQSFMSMSRKLQKRQSSRMNWYLLFEMCFSRSVFEAAIETLSL